MPRIRAILFFSFFLLILPAGLHAVKLLLRPDLRIKLEPIVKNRTEQFNYINLLESQSQDKFAIDYTANKVVKLKSKGTRSIFYNNYSNKYYPNTNTYLVIQSLLSFDEANKEPRKKDYKFVFNNQPIDTIVQISEPSYNEDGKYIIISTMAVYTEKLDILTYTINPKDLNVMWFCRTRLKVPEETLGHRFTLGNPISIGKQNFSSGRELYLAMHIGISENSFIDAGLVKYIARYKNSEVVELKPKSNLNPFGVIVVPANQTEWKEPVKIFSFPGSTSLDYIRPNGYPMVLATIGNNNNGSFSIPELRISKLDPTYKLRFNDDSWFTYVYFSVVDDNCYYRYRQSESYPEARHPSSSFITTGYDLNTNRCLLIILGYNTELNKNDKGSNRLEFNYVNLSNTKKPYYITQHNEQIEYLHASEANRLNTYPFEVDSIGLGFVIITNPANSEISYEKFKKLDLLKQQIISLSKNYVTAYVYDGTSKSMQVLFDISSDKISKKYIFKEFVGLVEFPNAVIAFTFLTEDNRFVAFDKSSNLLFDIPINSFFIFSNKLYTPKLISPLGNKHIYKIHTHNKIQLESDNLLSIYDIVANPFYMPNWHWVNIFVWLIYALGVVVYSVILIRAKYEAEFLTAEQVEAQLLAEKISHEKALAETRERIRSTFSVYLSPDLVDKLVAKPETINLEGSRENVAVMFIDIRGYTTIAEALTPDLVFKFLNLYINDTMPIIIKHKGFNDEIVGDAIKAVFGAPIRSENPSLDAVYAALEIVKNLKVNIYKKLKEHNPPFPEFNIGIGIHYGSSVLGTVGLSNRLHYTCVGDTVNVAARIQALTKTFGSVVLVSEEVQNMLPDSVYTGFVTRTRVKGRINPVSIYKAWDTECPEYFEFEKTETDNLSSLECAN